MRYFLLLTILCGACTSESTRVAIATQSRADEVAQTIFDRQREAMRIYMYRWAKSEITTAVENKNSIAAAAILEKVFQDDDLHDFWLSQHERAKALRIAGVDSKLYADQGILNLLFGSIMRAIEKYEAAIAGSIAANKTEGVLK